MKKELLNFIVCPYCRSDFNLSISHQDTEEIITGELFCKQCGRKFPIIGGIARILPLVISGKQQETQESFGYEWTHFPEMIKEWKKNFDWYFEPAGGAENLFGKTVLEIGCGKGRHTFYAAQNAKKIVVVDFSKAIDVAYQNNKQRGNIHFIQADIYHLPLRSEVFDFVYCLGVLHHLPDPEEGFRKILRPLKGGGGVLIYLYHNFSKYSWKYFAIKITSVLRFFTTKMPHGLLHVFCYLAAAPIYAVFVIPYKFLRIRNADLPLMLYAEYPFKVFVNDTFDRFSAPIENRYSNDEAILWYKNNHCRLVKIIGGGGWRIFGYKL